MSNFKVWLRPLGNACKVKVEREASAEQLAKALEQVGIECSQPAMLPGTPCYFFLAALSKDMGEYELRALLGNLPNVDLMLDPA